MAGVAQRIGIPAAVGGFLAGIVFSGPAAERTQQLLRPLREVFAAVFFVFFGFQIDPSTIPDTLLVTLVLALLGAAGKYATGRIAATYVLVMAMVATLLAVGTRRWTHPRQPPGAPRSTR